MSAHLRLDLTAILAIRTRREVASERQISERRHDLHHIFSVPNSAATTHEHTRRNDEQMHSPQAAARRTASRARGTSQFLSACTKAR